MTMRIRRFTVEEAREVYTKEPPRGASQSRAWSDAKAGASWDEAVRMSIDGDPESALGLKKYLGVLSRIRTAKRATSRWAESGSQVDVARYLSGEPECMIETVRARRPVPVIRLIIERCVPYYIDAETMRATGASTLAVVEALRVAGVPSEIWASFSIASQRDRGETLSEQVLIQEAGYALDIDRLAYWVANPSAFRRLGFALFEQEPEDIRKMFSISSFGGYGSSLSNPPNADEFDEVAPSWAGDTERWVSEVLERRAGIEVLEEDR